MYDGGGAPDLQACLPEDGAATTHALFQTLRVHNTPSRWDWMTGLPWLAAALVLLSAGVFLHPDAAAIGAGMILAMLCAAWQRSRALLRPHSLPARSASMPLLWLLCLCQPLVRDWGRVYGLLAQRALPSAAPTWPWRHLPLHHSRPGVHWSREAFWSEDQIGSEALLRAMQEVAPRHGIEWHDSLDAGACDAVLVTPQRRKIGLATVTEYHEMGGRLTRVAYGLRHLWWLDGPQALLLLAIPFTGLLHWPFFWTLSLLLVALAAWRAQRSVQALRSVRHLILEAARTCGLHHGRLRHQAPTSQDLPLSSHTSPDVCS